MGNEIIKIIKIFLASSSELKDDREQFEIFINRKNKKYIEQGIFLALVVWEDFIDAMSKTRLQDEYNKAITECHIFVSLFHTKVGKYTEEEFLKALETFKANGNLRIYTYFKDAPINMSQIRPEIMTLLNFKEKLHNLGHFHTSYADINDLKHKFGEQLNKIMPKLAREIEPAVHQEQQEIEQSPKSQIQQLEQQLEQEQEKLTEKEAIISQLPEQIKQLQSPSKIVLIGEVELKSEKGINYTILRDLLAAGKWKGADKETGKVMCQAAGREKEGWLIIASVNNFPCEDLRTINQLWLHYSMGKFGFSVQKEIYESLGGTRDYNHEVWKKFGEQVGWGKGGKWIEYNDLTFNLELAPQAHLPFWFSWGLLKAYHSEDGSMISSFAQRLVICEISSRAKLIS